MTDAEIDAAIATANGDGIAKRKAPEGNRDPQGRFVADKDWNHATPDEVREKLAEYGVNAW